jgi:hypothetical protein
VGVLPTASACVAVVVFAPPFAVVNILYVTFILADGLERAKRWYVWWHQELWLHVSRGNPCTSSLQGHILVQHRPGMTVLFAFSRAAKNAYAKALLVPCSAVQVRALFAVARILQPSVVFIDEIDSLMSARKSDGMNMC